MTTRKSPLDLAPNSGVLNLVERMALLKIALEMIDRNAPYAGDEFQGVRVAQSLVNHGMVVAYYTASRTIAGKKDFHGYRLTMRGNAAVGEIARIVCKAAGA